MQARCRLNAPAHSQKFLLLFFKKKRFLFSLRRDSSLNLIR